MSSDAVLVYRFPDGRSEFLWPGRDVSAGDLIEERGMQYVVTRTRSSGDGKRMEVSLAVVEPASAREVASARHL
jgi:hypothetical protein